jgi:hypothetical protein
MRSPIYAPLAGKWGGGDTRPDLSIIAKYQALGAQAFLHDFSRTDLTFQEATGQTLADDPGEAVGLALEMGQIGGKTLAQVIASQPEIVVNGDFGTGDLSGFTGADTGTGSSTYSGGSLLLVGTDGSNLAKRYQPLTLDTGSYYELAWSSTTSSGSATIGVSTGLSGANVVAALAGSGGRRIFQAASQNNFLVQSTSAGGNVSVSSISIRKIPGNHAVQSGSTGARPTRQAGGILTRDGSDDNLLSTLVGGAAGNTYATKIIAPATVSALQVLAGFGAAASIGRFALGINTSGNLCALVGADTTSTIVAPGTDVRGQTGVAALVEDGANVFLYWNGAQVFTKALNGAPSTAVPYRLGAFNNNGTAGSFTTASARLETAQQAAWSPAEIASISSYWNSLP